eukprot:m.721990 g.721990  ORF g.721990 m.721990 type:complete len:1011 (-) comp23015_c0_seq1:482-3514(-)
MAPQQSEWMHPAMSKVDASELAKKHSKGDGSYFLRPRSETISKENILCVIYKGQPTHHLITKNDDRFLVVNGKQYGEATTLQELVDELSSGNTPKWPVPLAYPIKPESGTPVNSTTAAPPPSENGSKSWSKSDFYHEVTLSKAESGELASNNNTGDGTFLVYPHAGGNDVLCVVYKGKPTHHLISRKEGVLVVNNRQFGDPNASPGTLEDLMATLSQRGIKGWPVPLQHAMPDRAKEARIAQANAAAQEAAKQQERDRQEQEARASAAAAAKAAEEAQAAAQAAADAQVQREREERKRKEAEEAERERIIRDNRQKEERIEREKAEKLAAEEAEKAEVARHAEAIKSAAEAVRKYYASVESNTDVAADTVVSAEKRDERIHDVGELQILLTEIPIFNGDKALVTVADAWDQLCSKGGGGTTDGAAPVVTVGNLLTTFDAGEMDRRRQDKDPEYAAELRARKVLESVAVEKARQAEKLLAAQAEEKERLRAAKEASEARLAQERAEQEAFNKLPKWKQEKIKNDRAAQAAAEASQRTKPAWQQALMAKKSSVVSAVADSGNNSLPGTPPSEENTDLDGKRRRDEIEREERERLAQLHQREEDERKAREQAEAQRLRDEHDEKARLAQEEEEERQRLADMPSWKRELYLKKKASGGGAAPVKRMSLASTPMDLMAQRRALLEAQEAEAEEKALSGSAMATVNRAWGALSARRASAAVVEQDPESAGRFGSGRRRQSSAKRTEEERRADALSRTIDMIKVKELEVLQQKQPSTSSGSASSEKKKTWGRSKLKLLTSGQAQNELDVQHEAATLVQAIFRGWKERTRLKKLRAEELQEGENSTKDKQLKACKVIHAAVRRFMTIQTIRARLAQREQALAEQDSLVLAQQRAELQALAEQQRVMAAEVQRLQQQRTLQQQQALLQQQQQAMHHNTSPRRTSRRKGAAPSPMHVHPVPRTQPLSVDARLMKIAAKAHQSGDSAARKGSCTPVDSTNGLFIVDGVYVNKEGSLAHTAV